jgi:hypothetical protein
VDRVLYRTRKEQHVVETKVAVGVRALAVLLCEENACTSIAVVVGNDVPLICLVPVAQRGSSK